MDVRTEVEHEDPRRDVHHPAHPKHPDHPDNHHHRAHHPHAHNIRAISAVYVIVVLAAMIAVGLSTNAPFGNVLISWLPALLLGVVAVVLLNHDHFDIRLLALILAALVVIFGALTVMLAPGIDLLAVIGLNLLLGGLFLLILGQSHQDPGRVVEVEAEEQDVPTILATIEDRCKAINFSIGRVYNVHHGATASTRDKIKIDNEWYNELSAAMEEPEENLPIIIGVVERIRRRLALLEKPEKDVFTSTEVSKLKKLERDPLGDTPIVQVLADNDSDPVDQYVVSAEEYCDIVLQRTE